jgi:hypothetical protein
VLVFIAAFVFVMGAMAQAQSQESPDSAVVAGNVTDAANHPVRGATVTLAGPVTQTTTSDANGRFAFAGVPFGVYQMTVSSTALGSATRTGIAIAGNVSIALQYDTTADHALKVIGSVSTSARVRFNVTPASVAIVDPTRAAFDGDTSWRRLLQEIPGVTVGGGSGGGTTNDTLPDAPFVPVQISINGTLPYETATLLDGMPLVGMSFSGTAGEGTDLGNYPLNGFGGLAIVRGPGANSPSIVDSIGGSVLLSSPGRVAHNQYAFDTSSDPYGGITGNALVAVRLNKLSVRVTYGIDDSPGPVNGFFPSYIAGIKTIDGQPFFCSGPCSEKLVPLPNWHEFPLYSIGTVACCFPMSTAWSQHTGSLSLHYDVSPTITAQLYYAGAESGMGQAGWQRDWIFTPPAGYTGSVAAGSQTYFEMLFQDPIEQSSSLLEERMTFKIGEGSLQLAALQNRTFGTQRIADPPSFTAQIWGGGAIGTATSNTPIVFNGGTYTVGLTSPDVYNWTGWSDNRDLSAQYVLPLGTRGNIGASLVSSYYDSPYTVYENFGTGPIYSGYSSETYERTDELHLFTNLEVAPNVSAGISGYLTDAHYHLKNPADAGAFIDENFPYAAPRAGIVWNPQSAVAVRASAGGGFATAPLDDLIGSNGAPSFSSSYYTVTEPNLDVKPEESFGFDLGTDYRFRRDTVLSFDAYHTNLFGQFYEKTNLIGDFSGLPLYATQYGNLGESRYEGLLASLNHDVPHGIYWSASGSLMRAYVVSVPSGFYNTASCKNCTNLYVVPGINYNGEFETAIPYSQGFGTVGYRWKPNTFIGIAGTYFGPNNTYYRPAFMEFDGSAGIALGKRLSLLATVRNFTNIYGGAIDVLNPSVTLGAPTIAGAPYSLYPEEYGPRALVLTLQDKF